ncbi:MAG: rhodanese-related sulfurtransferase [Bacteroidota bacterium]
MAKQVLHNKVNRKELRAKMQQSDEQRTTISFYKYYQLADPHTFRDTLYQRWENLGVFGRIYVAHEGINGQISVPSAKVEAFKADLYAIDWLNGVRLNIAVDDDGKSFFALKIKVRSKIVADGLNDETFDVTRRGKHLTAEEFNSLTDKEDSVLVDMRNHYESEVGHFDGAMLPDSDNFRDMLPMVEDMLEEHKDKHIVMYCTGGIRCEKASAYFKHRGFPKVYQLDGGIIEYTRQVKEQGLDNKFIGKNFVFDDRLGERISDDVIARCHQCGTPCDTHTNCKNVACNLLFIQCENCGEKFAGTCSDACHDFIQLPEVDQQRLRKTFQIKQGEFKKGRFGKSPFQHARSQETAE